MPKPWEVSPEEARVIGASTRQRLAHADRVASGILQEQLAHLEEVVDEISAIFERQVVSNASDDSHRAELEKLYEWFVEFLLGNLGLAETDPQRVRMREMFTARRDETIRRILLSEKEAPAMATTATMETLVRRLLEVMQSAEGKS